MQINYGNLNREGYFHCMQSEAPPAMPVNLKPQISRQSIPLIVWNLFPLFGVLALGWKPESVFICYALETIIVGVFNVFKLITVYRFGQPPSASETGVTGLAIIPFFLVHYYLFVAVQLSIFFAGSTGTFGPLGVVEHIVQYLGQNSFNASLGVYVLNSAVLFVTDFLLPGKYTARSMNEQMFEPYPRIVIQQFVVLLGGFIFSVTGNAYPVLFIFIGIKMYADLLLQGFDIGDFAKRYEAGKK